MRTRTYLTTLEMCQRLGLRGSVFERWRKRGWIPCARRDLRPRLYCLEDVEAALARCEEPKVQWLWGDYRRRQGL